ncbi:MAG TPA: Gfo/Idh/MocA family oxidoreductase [Acidimicrobiia bacterium]|nr:Gfo/Idh/MocA family oxidoreductase [Acidimicrobiia bacterium]
MEPVNWGVLSTANIAMTKVIPGMQRSKFSQVAGIASRSSDKARRAADTLGIPRWYGSYADLLADDDIEAVYIPLPNHMHHEWTLAAAQAGKHVLCEKPISLTARDARDMITACERSGVKLMEAFMYRQHPMWKEVKRMVDDGVIGEIQVIDTVFSFFNDDPTNIRNMPAAGGGALYDIGCYAVNVSRLLFGCEPDVVKATIREDETMGIDVVTSAVMRFGSGTASFVSSTRMEPAQRVDVYGTEGRLVIEIPFNIPPDRPTRILEVKGGSPPVDPGIRVHQIPPADAYGIQADAFSGSIRTGSPVPVSAHDGVANLEVIERIFADAKD